MPLVAAMLGERVVKLHKEDKNAYGCKSVSLLLLNCALFSFGFSFVRPTLVCIYC